MAKDPKDSKNFKFSQNLNHLIKTKNISQAALARKVGMNKSTLHNYCNGVLPQNLIKIKELSEFLGVPMTELLFGENPETVTVQIGGQIEGRFILTISKL